MYTYTLNNPINRIDPSGHDSYVFYEPKDWSGQAKSEEQRLTKLYGTPVHLIPISNTKEFKENWNQMGYDSDGNKIKIEGVSLLFHGHPTTIIINAETKQYVTTNPEGKTYESGTTALYIGSLNYKTLLELNVLTCNGGNINYTNNTAITFLENNNINKVTAWDGELGYTKKGSTYTPRLGGNQWSFFTKWMKGAIRLPVGEVTYTKNSKGYITVYYNSPES